MYVSLSVSVISDDSASGFACPPKHMQDGNLAQENSSFIQMNQTTHEPSQWSLNLFLSQNDEIMFLCRPSNKQCFCVILQQIINSLQRFSPFNLKLLEGF